MALRTAQRGDWLEGAGRSGYARKAGRAREGAGLRGNVRLPSALGRAGLGEEGRVSAERGEARGLKYGVEL